MRDLRNEVSPFPEHGVGEEQSTSSWVGEAPGAVELRLEIFLYERDALLQRGFYFVVNHLTTIAFFHVLAVVLAVN